MTREEEAEKGEVCRAGGDLRASDASAVPIREGKGGRAEPRVGSYGRFCSAGETEEAASCTCPTQTPLEAPGRPRVRRAGEGERGPESRSCGQVTQGSERGAWSGFRGAASPAASPRDRGGTATADRRHGAAK